MSAPPLFPVNKGSGQSRLEIAPETPGTLRSVLKRIVGRVPAKSGATWLVREDHVEITTVAAARQRDVQVSELTAQNDKLYAVIQKLLRHRFGYRPRSRNLRGPSYFAKAVMQKLLRDSGWVKRQRNARRPIDFHLDAAQPGKIIDLPKAA